ncbi:MAG: hypothetical protein IKN16_07920 [Selenomonadaceae bacterium]|nr:hypothetical protein [Selenomonadaceae bacterium]
MKIEGIASYVDKSGKHHSIEGIGSLPDNVALESLEVAGEFSFDKISCDRVKTSGEIDGKSLSGKNFSGEGTVAVDAVEFETFKLSGSADIDKLVAEEIIMESRGGSIGKIKCRNVKIFHGEIHNVGSSIMSKIFGGKSEQSSRVQIKSIEADKIHVENCAVDVIRCKDAFIGKNCVIEKLFVAGECKIDSNSTVGETIRTASDT